ncbi:helix-turn-helix transcriptional regulator [Streptomyces diastaticus]|uniref:helix-turn-helix domain-containing protein n=1 Tax=Streptomyces diastaticus TaxID=1956 RepID=UPI003447DCAB
MTQTDLARIIKTSRSTISRIESGTGTIPREIPELLDEVFATEGRFKALHEAIVAKGYPAHSRRRLALEPRRTRFSRGLRPSCPACCKRRRTPTSFCATACRGRARRRSGTRFSSA